MVASHPRLTEFADVLLGARLAVEGLDYLNRLDAEMMPAAGARPFGFDSMLVDIAHARWAVGTAATAIDLCAAVIGRLHAGYPRPNGSELDVGGALRLSSQLSSACPDAWAWLQAVDGDSDYQVLVRARHGFIHRQVSHRGSASVIVPSTGEGQVAVIPHRTDFVVPGATTPEWKGTTDLMALARNVARTHVGAFRQLVANGLV